MPVDRRFGQRAAAPRSTPQPLRWLSRRRVRA